MKAALKLVLLNLFLTQIVASVLILIPYAGYMLVTTGNIAEDALVQSALIPIQLTGQLMMGIYLWKSGYVSRQKATWSAISAPYLLCSGVAILSSSFLLTALMKVLDWIPNIMEESFNILQSGWGGLLAIAIVGPVIEELLFRGAVTKALLQQYAPRKAILISALLFGVFHLNPAQMLPAFCIGILLGWIYYKSGSLIPCIFMHILNNSVAIYISIRHPEMAENTEELIGGTIPYLTALLCVALLLTGSILYLRRLNGKIPV
ncbi:CPBP family intramembrane glutamic endopeptidase [uncultured Bacteroides sp.]|uniref:CPBP family intramembrane glutamic endopeptidase n=1 Tax=uncultured Bacteroides sp. TaxID=162156 RepID=UPI0025F3B0D9|nr:type II CAAX endopeptidase family protein [uncultured Bacteroides sp.]